MDMKKNVATKVALTVLEKVRATDHWQDIKLKINWEELEQSIPVPNFDELLNETVMDDEAFTRMLDKLNKEIEVDITRLESSFLC